jgi:hypothetical protein
MIKKSKILKIVLPALFIIAVAFTYVFFDKSQPNWFLVFWSVVGSTASVFGICFTVYQLQQIREETAIILAASEETKKELFKLENFGDVTRAIALIHETQTHLRSSKFEIALIKVQEFKIILIEYISTYTLKTLDKKLNEGKVKVNLLTSSLEKEIEQNQNSIIITQVNCDLENLKDTLIEARIQIKKQL